MSLTKEEYQETRTGKKFRSRKKTNWKWVLKNKKGKILDSTYVVFITEAEEYLESTISNNIKVGLKKEREPFIPYKWAIIVTKDRPDAHIVELYYKGKIKTTALVSTAR